MGLKAWDSSRPDGAGIPAEPVLWNAFANMASLAGHAVTIVRGEGSTVYDDHGRAYLDALASLWYCNVGHGRAELADAAAAQMRQLAAYQTFEPFSNQPAEALARRVAGLAPMAGAKVFFTPGGGSDAVDTAAKLARGYWRAAGEWTVTEVADYDLELRGDDGSEGRKQHQSDDVVLWHLGEEHLMDLLGVADDQRALTEVVEQ